MSAGRSACLCWTLLSVSLLASSSAGLTIIRAEPGQTVSLPCKALNNDPVTVVDWSRIDPKPEEDVLLYHNNQFDYQNPVLKNRMDLQERQIKDGDMSLSLKNVTIEDSGTYNCRILTKTNRRKRAAPVESISTIRLEVVPPGHTAERKEDGGDKEGGDKEGGDKGGSVGLIVGLMVPGVLLGIVGFLIFRRYRHRYQPPPLQSSDQLA